MIAIVSRYDAYGVSKCFIQYVEYIRDLVYDRLPRVNIHIVRTIYSHFQIGSKFDQCSCSGFEVAVCLRLEQHICLFLGKV